MQNFATAGFFGLVGIIFTLLGVILMRKGINQINFPFILGVVALIISSFICMLDFAGLVPSELSSTFFTTGNLMMFWAPAFFFITGMLILYGTQITKTLRSKVSIIFYGVLVVYVIVTMTFLAGINSFDRGLIAGAVFVAFGLLLNICVYLIVFRVIPEQRTNLTFLLAGMVISVAAVVLQVIQKGSVEILPMEFEFVFGLMINVGILIFALSFTNLPSKVIQEGQTVTA